MRGALILTAFAWVLLAQTQHPGEEFKRALDAQQRGDFATAERLYRALLSAHPDAIPVRVNLASVLMATRHFAEAAKTLMPAEPANPDIAWLLGNALIYSGQAAEGVIRIDRVCALAKAEACLFSAETRLNLDQYDRALKQVDAALKLDPGVAHGHTLRGMILEHTGDYQGATAELEKGLAANAKDASAHVYLGAILLYQRRLETARAHLELAVKLDPSSQIGRYQLALVKSAQGELESAAKDLEDVAERSPQWLQPHVQLAALYYRLKRPQDGLRERAVVDQLSASASSSRQLTPVTP